MVSSPSARSTPGNPSHGARVAVICALLLIAFGLTAWAAVRSKSAAFDEPMHAMGAYVMSQYGDFRVNPEDPPLWQRWISLALRRNDLKVDTTHPYFDTTLDTEQARWTWTLDSLYRTPGNDVDAFLMKARTMLILLGVALGAMIAFWSWRLGGGVAAVAGAFLFALDPNFLANAALVKNDVAISLVAASLAFATWCAGRRLTRASGLAVVLLGAAAMVTKFSGPLLLISLFVTIAIRVLLPIPWLCGAREVRSLRGKAAVGTTLLVMTGIAAFFGIWACYSFRYQPSPSGQTWDFEANLHDIQIAEVKASHPDNPIVTPEAFDERGAHPAFTVRVLTYVHDHHLLPQTWTYGMLYVYGHSRMRASYLCGEMSNIGFRSYFPLAFLFKTPVATLIALAGSLLFGVTMLALNWRKQTLRQTDDRSPPIWSITCLAAPVLVFGFAALQAKLNIGLRHILPLYPFFYIAAACAVAGMWRRWGRTGHIAFAVLAAALLIETTTAFPNYIPFFNRLAGGSTGGLRLLGDSNLDWGQDLPLLAEWQKKHPTETLYLSYFGTADPSYYGIRYIALPGHHVHRPDIEELKGLPASPGVIAISATNLQGIYLHGDTKNLYTFLRNTKPLAILGGTIYLFDYKP